MQMVWSQSVLKSVVLLDGINIFRRQISRAANRCIISILYCLNLICGVLFIVTGWVAMVVPACTALSSIPAQSNLFGSTSRPEVRMFG